MKYFSYIIILLIIAQLTGCASYYASRSNYNEIVDEWLNNNEFSKIESSLEKLSKKHPHYRIINSKKNSIQLRKNKFIEKTIATAKNQISQEEWQLALNTYDEALAKARNNQQLLKAKNEFIKERDTQVKELRKSLLLRRARALVQYKPIYIKLKKLIPKDYSTQYDINKFEQEKDETSRNLMRYGSNALKVKNYNLAEECFDLSNELVASKKTQQLAKQTKDIIKRNSDKKTAHDLISAFNEAYQTGNFPKARLYLDQLITINPTHKKSKQLKEQLDRDINTRIEKGINLGKTQYSQGKINAALTTWQELSKLDPKNEELSALIFRAKKVSSKIEQLEKSPAN